MFFSKRFHTIRLFSLSFIILACSCGTKPKIAVTLKQFESHAITLPSEMPRFNHGAIEWHTIPSGKLFVFYVSPEECTSCLINNLQEYSHIFAIGERLNFTTLFLISPKESELTEALESLRLFDPGFPVWLDLDCSFYHSNRHIPSDYKYHHFLLNENRKPIFVGIPYSTKMLEVLEEAITTNSKKSDK